MLLTLIVIVLLLAAAVGGYLGWCLHVQRDQSPGRHRMIDKKTTTPSAA